MATRQRYKVLDTDMTLTFIIILCRDGTTISSFHLVDCGGVLLVCYLHVCLKTSSLFLSEWNPSPVPIRSSSSTTDSDCHHLNVPKRSFYLELYRISTSKVCFPRRTLISIFILSCPFFIIVSIVTHVVQFLDQN